MNGYQLVYMKNNTRRDFDHERGFTFEYIVYFEYKKQ